VIKYDLRKYSFTERIVDLWNCLPTCVVKSQSLDSLREILRDFGVAKTFIITIYKELEYKELETKLM